MSASKPFLIIIVVLLLLLGFSSFYTVNEGQSAILLRLGKLKQDPKTEMMAIAGPGLHFKMPFIETPIKFDMRTQTLDVQSSRIVTAEKKYVIVDYYVKWRIKNLLSFYIRTSGNYQQAGILLQQQLNDTLRAEFGLRNIQELVSEDRVKIMAALLKQANVSAANLGLDVVDVRIKQIELPPTVRNTVFQQMRAERERVANEHRSLGEAKAEAIKAQADANVTVAIATAQEQAAQIRSTGDSTAARIYAEAYTQDPSFYAFYRSMLAYRESFADKKDILVLKPDSQFFRYFNNPGDKILQDKK